MTTDDERAHRVSGKLRIRLGMFFVISIVLLCFVIFDVLHGQLVWWLSLAAIVGGIVIGYLFGRLSRVAWHPTEEKIVTQMDTLGIVLIGAYIALAIGRNFLLKEWFTGAALTAFTLSFAAGLLFGRSLGLYRSIDKVLKKGRD